MVPCKREVLVTALKPQGAQRPRENEISRAASAPESGRRLVVTALQLSPLSEESAGLNTPFFLCGKKRLPI